MTVGYYFYNVINKVVWKIYNNGVYKANFGSLIRI